MLDEPWFYIFFDVKREMIFFIVKREMMNFDVVAITRTYVKDRELNK